MTEEEKIRLNLLANCIIEDSERVTIPDNDTQALHAEIARLRARCEAYKQFLVKIDEALGLLHRAMKNTLNL